VERVAFVFPLIDVGYRRPGYKQGNNRRAKHKARASANYQHLFHSFMLPEEMENGNDIDSRGNCANRGGAVKSSNFRASAGYNVKQLRALERPQAVASCLTVKIQKLQLRKPSTTGELQAENERIHIDAA